MNIIFVFAALCSLFSTFYEKGLNLLLCISMLAFHVMCALYFVDLHWYSDKSVFLSILTVVSLCYMFLVTSTTGNARNKSYPVITYIVVSFHSLGAWYLLSKLLWS